MTKYNVLTIADIHWGAFDPELMDSNLNMFLDIIYSRDDIDMVVILGDYFDHRLHLNSRTAVLAIQWFTKLIEICKDKVKCIRVVKGTIEHDNNQLEIFKKIIDEDSNFLKIFDVTTYEETLPGLRCIYCPDETINANEYYMKYANEFGKPIDIGFFHGSFNVVLPQIRIDTIHDNELPTIVFDYNFFTTNVNGPLISGHWHDYTNHGSLYYVGSYDSWIFGEDKNKGCMLVSYNIDTNEYKTLRILNENARVFKTLSISNNDYKSPEDFNILTIMIEDIFDNNPDIHLRVEYSVVIDNDESIMNFNVFKSLTSRFRNLKIDMKDIVKKRKQKEKTDTFINSIEKYDYIFSDKSNNVKSLTNKIKIYLETEQNIIMNEDKIEKILAKYVIGE